MNNDNGLQRAALYARCSTEEESQKDALKKQVQEGKNCIKKNGWSLADVYVEAVSGTVAGKRSEYQRLLKDMRSDRFDIIVIKCLDRLMRETKEWFSFCDKMIREGKRLYLYMEGRFFDPEEDHANLLSGIEAIMAEQYSRNLSRKINNAHKNRQKSGESVVLTSRTYGYKKENKQVLIDSEQAEAVKKMFYYCREGFGGRYISKILEQQGFRNLNGEPIGEATIRRIIRNPLYKGVAVMNKTHYDFNRKCMIKNPPEKWIYHENAVPAIVDVCLWEEANKAMDLRSEKAGYGQVQSKGAAGNVSHLSGKLICGLCKSPYYRTTRKYGKTDQRLAEWKCSRYLSRGRTNLQDQRDGCAAGCDNVHVREDMIMKVLEEAGRKVCTNLPDRDTVIEKVVCILRKILGKKDGLFRQKRLLELDIEEMKREQERLLDLMLRGTVEEDIYIERNQKLKAGIQRKEEAVTALEEQNHLKLKEEERLELIKQRLENGIAQTARVYEVADRVDRIEIYPEYLEFYFQSFGEKMMEPFRVAVPEGVSFSAKFEREKEKREIINIMKENPGITAKEIAGMMDKTLSSVRRRIDQLRGEKKIQYVGKGGHGYWKTEVPSDFSEPGS